MPLYELNNDTLSEIPSTSYSQESIREREGLQALLRERVEVIAPDCLVVAEEFGQWEESRRRIDLLAIDKEANLVVIELKRTEDGGHMELQALRYAAMVSPMTFDQVVESYEQYLEHIGSELEDPRQAILDFLDWEEADDDAFAQEVHIVLVSAEFSKEITSSVIWLNNQGLNIRCVRLRPHRLDDKLIIEAQQIIPLPEATDYQIRLRKKEHSERSSRSQNRDLTRYTVTYRDEVHQNIPKRKVVWFLVNAMFNQDMKPEAIHELLGSRSRLIGVPLGEVGEDFYKSFVKSALEQGWSTSAGRWFLREGEYWEVDGRRWALTKMWGRRFMPKLEGIIAERPELELTVEPE